MPIIKPTGVKSQGNTKLSIVLTLSSTTSPSLAQITAGTSLELSGYLYGDGWTPSIDTNRGAAPRRIYQKTITERIGVSTAKLGNLRYMVGPQAAAAADGKKAMEKLVEGQAGWFIERLGLDAETVDFAIGQFVNVYPILTGPQLTAPGSDDEFSEYLIDQPIEITSPPSRDKAIVA